ncbi:MAG: ubiquitin-like domain-containing protein [Chloroflexota bacterium]|nr:ubiquitin-like domain-containing protein [Chloroflexota bacterium]
MAHHQQRIASDPFPRWFAAGLIAATMLGLAAGFLVTQQGITVTIDGQSATVWTHQRTVAGLLRELNLSLLPTDTLFPSLDSPLREGDAVLVRRAVPVVIQADGRRDALFTQANTIQELLAEAHLTVSTGDQLLVNGRQSTATASLRPNTAASATSARDLAAYAISAVLATDRAASLGSSTRGETRSSDLSGPLHLELRRAIPVLLRDGAAQSSFLTVAGSVGEALRAEGIPVYLGDSVQPPLGTAVSPNVQVSIQRARPVTIVADGQTIHTRTQVKTVEDLLAEEGIRLDNKDYSQPEPIAAVASDLTVRVTRVREEIITEEEAIPYNTVFRPAPELEIDQARVAQTGLDGIFKRRIHVVYENGVETKRLLEREWVDQEPVTKINAYGTKIVMHDLMTADGPIQYWRKLTVSATWYNSSHGWFGLGSAYYGMTRTGLYATKGIIAVDPSVIRLHTRMYVPGYGFGAAEDTGGLIRGMRIDLAYDEGDPNSHGLGWTTVYLLPPVPPASEIPWILPDYPR